MDVFFFHVGICYNKLPARQCAGQKVDDAFCRGSDDGTPLSAE